MDETGGRGGGDKRGKRSLRYEVDRGPQVRARVGWGEDRERGRTGILVIVFLMHALFLTLASQGILIMIQRQV